MKKILRGTAFKLLAFLLILACVCGTASLLSERLITIAQNSGDKGVLYQFDSSLELSRWMGIQMNYVLQEMCGKLKSSSPGEYSLGADMDFPGEYYGRFGDVIVRNTSFGGSAKSDTQFVEDAAVYAIIRPYESSSTVTLDDSFAYILSDAYRSKNEDTFETAPADSEFPYDDMEEEPDYADSDIPEDAFVLMVRVTPQELEPYRQQWESERQSIRELIQLTALLVGIALLAFVYLLFVTGRKPADDAVHLAPIDRIPAEVNICLAAFAAMAGIGAYVTVLDRVVEQYLYALSGDYSFFLMPAIMFLTATAALVLELLLSLARNMKNHTLVERSLCLRACRWCVNLCLRALRWCLQTLKKFFPWAWNTVGRFAHGVKDGRAAAKLGKTKYTLRNALFGSYSNKKVFYLFIGYSLLLVTLSRLAWLADREETLMLLFMLLMAICIWTGISFLKSRLPGFDDVVKGVHRIREGEINYKINAAALPEGVLRTLAEDINTLGDGMQNALQNAIKAERMKSELITNVSHDLKTPLTSILNYADLLCQATLTPEEANDYAKIIYQKGLRLKNLTSDLFDISKVQSGAETIECERLDLCTLVQQALAEQDKAIAASELTLRVDLPDSPVNIWADGRKMSRVLENLIGNCLKYALKGTRVFLSVTVAADGAAALELKNIANYEMDFAADEITERFVRGDSSRSTDGSGLGLAIAKSYTEACGGKLNVETDGDLFKVRILFPLYTA